MAEDTLFDIDAGQILAKLHLSAKTQAPNFIVVNTGIKDEKDGDSAENPGKSTFDFSNKSGEYETGFITLDFKYHEKIVLEEDPVIKKANEKLKKAKDSRAATDDEKSIAKAVSERNNEIIKRFPDLGKKIKPESSDDEIKAAVEEVNKERADEKEKKVQDHLKKLVLPQVTAYFETFCGKGAFKKPSIDNLVPVAVSLAFKGLKNKDAIVESYKIKAIDEKETKTWWQEYLKNQDKEVAMNLAVKVQYNINVDAM